MKNNIIILLLLLTFSNCGTKKIDVNDEYRSYQIAKGLDPGIKRPFQHFKDFLTYQDSIKKQNLLNSKILKVNQVYIYYSETVIQTFGTFIEEGKQSVTFVIYSDEGLFCLSTFDLSSKYFGIPENGVIKLLKPIVVNYFGDFEITNDFIKTRKRNKTPFKEWYDYVNGSVKNDTINFTETYIGKGNKFEKKMLAITHKTNFKEVYQTNLKTEKLKDQYGLIYFRVTGEFNIAE